MKRKVSKKTKKRRRRQKEVKAWAKERQANVRHHKFYCNDPSMRNLNKIYDMEVMGKHINE